MKTLYIHIIVLIVALVTFLGKVAAKDQNIVVNSSNYIALDALDANNAEQELMVEKWMIDFFTSTMSLYRNEMNEEVNSEQELRAEKLMINFFASTMNKAQNDNSSIADNKSKEEEIKLQKSDSTCKGNSLTIKVKDSKSSEGEENVVKGTGSKILQF